MYRHLKGHLHLLNKEAKDKKEKERMSHKYWYLFQDLLICFQKKINRRDEMRMFQKFNSPSKDLSVNIPLVKEFEKILGYEVLSDGEYYEFCAHR